MQRVNPWIVNITVLISMPTIWLAYFNKDIKMKKNKIRFFVVLLISSILAICSCTRVKNNSEINSPFDSFSIDVSQFIDSCNSIINKAELIPLELNENAILNGIDKIIITQTKIIVFDKRQKQVIVFDEFGNYYSKIKNLGNGPNEYLFPTDILFDESDNKVGILDQGKGTILWYNLEGIFLQKNKIDRKKLILDNAIIKNNNIYHFVHNPKAFKNQKLINITDLSLNKIKFSMLESNPEHISKLHMHPFGIYKDDITIHIPFDRHLYKISQEGLESMFLFDFKDKNLPDELLERILMEKNNTNSKDIMNYNRELLKYVVINTVIPLKDYVFIDISYKLQKFYTIVPIIDKNASVFRGNLGKYAYGKYVGCNTNDNSVYFEVPSAQINKLLISDIGNKEAVKSKYNLSNLKNNPWILKIQF
jgi:hypothetical protein